MKCSKFVCPYKSSAFNCQLLTLGILLLSCTPVVLASNPQTQPNPLAITAPDSPSPQQPLEPAQRLQLQNDLDELNAQAITQLQNGDTEAAFEIWERELQLRRQLGLLEEVEALARVGEIAWSRNQKPALQQITGRLRSIKQQIPTPSSGDLPLLQALGQAFQQVRLPESAINVYQQILLQVRQEQDRLRERETLKTLGELYLTWFDYPNAATTYEALLSISQDDAVSQELYLRQLAYIYTKVQEPEKALKVNQQLAELYRSRNNLEPLPAIEIAIASHHTALGQPEEASRSYQQAYEIAFSQQHFALASEALQKLGNLHEQQNQLDSALKVYQSLLEVYQQSYDFYGMMNAYDRIGQVYRQQQNYRQALEAFQQGLQLAKSLQHQEAHFNTQMQQVFQQAAP